VKEVDDALEAGNMLVFPEAEVLRSDATLGRDSGGFGEYEPGASDGAAAEVDEMPVVRETVFGGVFAHRRDDDPVGEGYAAELNGGEEVIYWLGHRD